MEHRKYLQLIHLAGHLFRPAPSGRVHAGHDAPLFESIFYEAHDAERGSVHEKLEQAYAEGVEVALLVECALLLILCKEIKGTCLETKSSLRDQGYFKNTREAQKP